MIRWLGLRGRIPRARWWLAHQLPAWAILFVMALDVSTITYKTGHEKPRLEAVWYPLLLAVGWLLTAGMVQRLHDRGRTGLWALAVWALPGLPWLLMTLFMEGVRMHGNAPGGDALGVFFALPTLGAFVLYLWLFVELGFLRGTAGPNRFGPDPLGGAVPPMGHAPVPPGQHGAPPWAPSGGYAPPPQPPPAGQGWGSPPPPGPWGQR